MQTWDKQLESQINRLNQEAGKLTSCKTCLHWVGNRCALHTATPPEDFIQANTCEDHDDDDIPF